mgnify:CR=1 FL=1
MMPQMEVPASRRRHAAGMALAAVFRHAGAVLIFATALTGFVEVSQLTGIFGLYDCPYRQFEVDDAQR